MAKQFTAIMAREAIIGPTINSQVDGLEYNTRRKGYCGELEREIKGKGLSFYPCTPSVALPCLLSPFLFSSTLIPPFPSPIILTILFYSFYFLLPTYACIFQLILQWKHSTKTHTYTHFSNGGSATIKWLFPHTPLNTLIARTFLLLSPSCLL